MREARKKGNWLVLTALLAGMCISCDKNSDANYSSVEGLYTCQESSSHAGVKQYFVEIDKVNNSENLYIILNFHNKGENEFLYAEIDGNALLISNQSLLEIRVDGEGTVDEEFRSIQLNYLTDDGTTLLDYYAAYTR